MTKEELKQRLEELWSKYIPAPSVGMRGKENRHGGYDLS